MQVEALTTYILNISAQDEGGLSTITQIILRVNDTNNNRPVFDKSHYEFKVLEGDYEGAELGLVHAKDGDYYDNGRVTYEVGEGSGLFRVEEGTGAVRVWGRLDREEGALQTFTLIARDHGEKPLTSTVNVTVVLLDQNDNQPLFFGYDRLLPRDGLHTTPVFSSHINSYRVDAGVRVADVFANDSDSASNGVVEFRLMDHTSLFYIHPETGELTTLVPIGEAYNVTVQASDQGRPPRHATAEVHLTLRPLPLVEEPRSQGETDENIVLQQPFKIDKEEVDKIRAENDESKIIARARPKKENKKEDIEEREKVTALAPASPSPYPLPVGQMFQQEVYSLEVQENVAVPRLLLHLGREVVGATEGLPVHYRIVGSNYGLFSVDEEEGRLSLMASPDREQRDLYILRVKVGGTRKLWYAKLEVVINPDSVFMAS